MKRRPLTKGLATAVVAPLATGLVTGHLKSAITRKPVNRAGEPVPWYTQPAIEFIASLDFSDDDVLEFGSGYSTLWWGARANSVLSVEHDAEWYATIRNEVPANVDLRLVPDVEAYPVVDEGRTFGVIIIDGGPRAACAQPAIDRRAEDGLIIVDNSEVGWAPSGYPILDLMDSAGLARVDFYGLAPGVVWQGCTSIFFARDTRRFSGLGPPRQPPRSLRLG